jgi:hypothetical protein
VAADASEPKANAAANADQPLDGRGGGATLLAKQMRLSNCGVDSGVTASAIAAANADQPLNGRGGGATPLAKYLRLSNRGADSGAAASTPTASNASSTTPITCNGSSTAHRLKRLRSKTFVPDAEDIDGNIAASKGLRSNELPPDPKWPDLQTEDAELLRQCIKDFLSLHGDAVLNWSPRLAGAYPALVGKPLEEQLLCIAAKTLENRAQSASCGKYGASNSLLARAP